MQPDALAPQTLADLDSFRNVTLSQVADSLKAHFTMTRVPLVPMDLQREGFAFCSGPLAQPCRTGFQKGKVGIPKNINAAPCIAAHRSLIPPTATFR